MKVTVRLVMLQVRRLVVSGRREVEAKVSMGL